MRRLLSGTCTILFVLCSGCTDGAAPDNATDFRARSVTLPDGTAIKAEVMTEPADMARGMMFRDSLQEGRGMLFIHPASSKYAYWMFQTKVPLDIIWMDVRGKVVEISENTPPCKTVASQCVNYGGTVESSVVLELPGGQGRKHGVRVGELIRF
ncbi:MAG: DUF192 domain-containing protein [Bryobacteraceae bacterium]|nr:DUF192 domain-containing protein [Bryobacteraceae bacterium]